MGLKLLIIEACLLAGEDIATPAEVGEEVEVSKDDAAALTRMGRALYLSKEDDPTKGTLTATAEDKSNVKKRAQAIKADREAKALAAKVATPQGMVDMLAAAMAAALASQQAASTPTTPAA